MLNERTLKSSLQAGSVLPVYVIAGDDIYLKRQALKRIINATVEPDDEINLVNFSNEADLQQVYDELMAFPIMADRKCVILSEFNIDAASKNEIEKLCNIISETSESAVFVLFFGTYEVDFKKSSKTKEIFSAVEKVGGAVVQIEHKTSYELSRWLIDSAKKQGLILSPANANHIIEICSADINVLSGEMTKLCSFQKSGEITREIIDKVCVKSVEASVYDLAKRIIAGDTSGAMNHLDELFYMNIEPMSIFYNISTEFINMYRALSAKKEGRRPKELGDEFGLGRRAFVLERAEENLRKFDLKKLELSFDTLIKTEMELKSYGVLARRALEKLVVRLIYIMKTGEVLD